jgi:lipopolysaccharide transport system ATP-binding protein
MSDVALQMDHVYKMFRKGETFSSLRDLVPALSGKMFQGRELSDNDKREFWALQDLSFEVKRGEAFAIIGNNGAGKSTALKILSRIMKPTKGHMVVNGRLSALIEVSAGFHQDLTGRENIFLNGTILGMTKREIAAKFDQIVAFSGLEEFIDTPVKRYSSGMYARLGFSVAAHVDPDVLIVDEVLSVGDYVFQRKCMDRMKEAVNSGVTVLFVSHNLKAIAEFCTRALLLDKGKTVAIGPVEEVISVYLNEPRSKRMQDAHSAPVAITRVAIRGEFGECSRFKSGQKAWIDLEVTARARCTNIALAIFLKTDEYQDIFSTSTERLGVPSFSLDEGEVYRATFELSLNMASGIYHLAVLVFRYDTRTRYDSWESAATVYLNSDEDVGGPVHCFPKVTRHQVIPALDGDSSAIVTGLAGRKSDLLE